MTFFGFVLGYDAKEVILPSVIMIAFAFYVVEVCNTDEDKKNSEH